MRNCICYNPNIPPGPFQRPPRYPEGIGRDDRGNGFGDEIELIEGELPELPNPGSIFVRNDTQSIRRVGLWINHQDGPGGRFPWSMEKLIAPGATEAFPLPFFAMNEPINMNLHVRVDQNRSCVLQPVYTENTYTVSSILQGVCN